MISGLVFVGTVGVVFLTSVLSGVLGMGGGLILMAFLAAVLPVSTAMIIHGIVQATANGSRFLLLWQHVSWRALPAFGIGMAAAVLIFSIFVTSTEKWVIYIAVGLLPFIPKNILVKVSPDIMKPGHAVVGGLCVTLLQMLAGASGPLLDMFFQDTRLNRHQIIATKAVTQTAGHLIKASFYMTVAASVDSLPVGTPMILMLMLTALIGTRIGTSVLERTKEEQFRIYFKTGVRIAGLVCIMTGVRDLLL